MALTKVTGGVIADATIITTDIASETIVTGNILDGTIVSADMALDPRNASNLNSGDVPTAQLDNVDLTGLSDDIAILAFKTQANGNLARYNLVDQSVDSFEDASGISASDSTNEIKDSSGKYYSGGVVTRTSFTTTGNDTYTTPAALVGTLEVLVVAGAGGGSGGGNGGGGGGAGGLVYVNEYTAAASTTYNLTIGAGAAAVATGNSGNDGADSVFDTSGTATTLTASGGGGGGNAAAGKVGGSGGGGWQTSNTPGGASDQTATFGLYSNVGFGFAGGQGGNGAPYQGGGGGGASEVGSPGQGTSSGDGIGGDGKAYTIADGTTSVYYAGGGGGGLIANWPGGAQGGAGGSGGGGKGGYGNHSPQAFVEPVAGTANTGGGGGGGRNDGGGAAGGSGIIIVAHKIPGDMTLESNTITAQAAPTKADLVFTYSNGAGTAVLGTNITAEVSMDGGTTFTNFAIAAGDVQGTTGGQTIVSKNNVTITTTSGTSMRYRIKTLVQSVSMDTRIHAVSLGWS